MLELVSIDALVAGMFVVKVTKQTGKISVATAGKISAPNDVTALAKKGVLQVQIDLTKSTHLDSDDKQDKKEDGYINESGLSYKQQLAHSPLLQILHR